MYESLESLGFHFLSKEWERKLGRSFSKIVHLSLEKHKNHYHTKIVQWID